MSRRLDIDFAPVGWQHSLHHASLFAWGLLLFAVLLCGTAVSFGIHGQHVHEERMVQYHAQAARLHLAEDQAERAVAHVPLSLPAPQANAINAIVRQLNLPWRDLKNALAQASSAKVALIAVEPDAAANKVRITAETRNSSDMIGYIEALKLQPFFRDVRLLRHQQNEQDENRPVRFELQADRAAGVLRSVHPAAFAEPASVAVPPDSPATAAGARP